MKYKPDWEKVKKRYEAFWAKEVIDRAVFHVTAPKPDRKCIPAPKNPSERFANSDYLFESAWACLKGTYWGADALPLLPSGLGGFFPDFVFGGRPSYGETVWMQPAFTSLAAPGADFEMHFDTPYLARQEEHLRRLCAAARSNCLVMMPPVFGGMDCLAGLIGAEQLCLELAEPTPALRRALARIDAAGILLYERFRTIGVANGVEATSFLPLWAPGRYGALQCDFMVMIGQAHFLEYAMPSLRHIAAFLDHSLFHLDGAEATHHLDALLDCENLDGIQWQQGSSWDGSASILPWLPMLKRIQQAGKRVYVNCEAQEVESVMKALSSKGLFLASAAANAEQALQLERLVAKLTHD